MTDKQTSLYWREWGALGRRCKKEGWTVPDRSDLHVRALGYRKSSKALTNPELDKVLGVFRAYSQVENVNSQVRQLRQPRTRLEHKIKIDQVRLLSVVLSEQVRDGVISSHPEFAEEGEVVPAKFFEPNLEAGMAFVAKVMQKRFGTEDLAEISDVPVPRFLRRHGDLVLRDGQPVVESEESDLECLRNTLAARINTLRNKRVPNGRPANFGWSIHDLNQAAGVACESWCSRCAKDRFNLPPHMIAREIDVA